MTFGFWEWVRVANLCLFLIVFALFGVVNWWRRDGTDKWDAIARFASWAYWGCAAVATFDAIWSDVPTGPRQGPIFACLALMAVAYAALLRRAIRERRMER